MCFFLFLVIWNRICDYLFYCGFFQKNEEKNNNKNGKVNRNDCKYKIKVIDKQIEYNEKTSFIFATKINIFAFEMDVFIEFVFDCCMKNRIFNLQCVCYIFD